MRFSKELDRKKAPTKKSPSSGRFFRPDGPHLGAAPMGTRAHKGVSGRMGKCLHVSAVAAFNKVKKWVELNEPEHFTAFVPKKK